MLRGLASVARETGPSAGAGPLRDLHEREFRDRVRSTIERLPPAQRETLVLRAYEGLRYDAIAEILGVTVHAVKANLAEARSKVAAWIGESGAHPPRRRRSQDGKE
jgi:RNA polymerase sigma-70 factor (ECF subfamily)